MRIDENEVYTTKEVAEILKVSLPTIKRMLKDGRLPSTRIGRQHRFLGRDLLDILESQRDLRPGRAGAVPKPREPAAAPGHTYIDAPPPSQQRTEERQRSYMIGKKVRSDITDDEGNVLFPRGTIVTDEVIREAGKHQKMMALFSNLE